MEYVITSEISAKERFFDSIIRTYVHRRIYNLLYLGFKAYAIYNLLNGLWMTPFLIVMNLCLFFYIDLYIVYQYFRIKHAIKNFYGNDLTQTLYLKEDTIEMKTKNQHMTIQWKDISYVKETRWYFFMYNQNKVIYSHIFKWFMTKDDYNTLKKYFEEQDQLGREILLKKKIV